MIRTLQVNGLYLSSVLIKLATYVVSQILLCKRDSSPFCLGRYFKSNTTVSQTIQFQRNAIRTRFVNGKPSFETSRIKRTISSSLI